MGLKSPWDYGVIMARKLESDLKKSRDLLPWEVIPADATGTRQAEPMDPFPDTMISPGNESSYAAYQDWRREDPMRAIALDNGYSPEDAAVDRDQAIAIAMATAGGIKDPRFEKLMDIARNDMAKRNALSTTAEKQLGDWDQYIIPNEGGRLQGKINEALYRAGDEMTPNMMRDIGEARDFKWPRNAHDDPFRTPGGQGYTSGGILLNGTNFGKAPIRVARHGMIGEGPYAVTSPYIAAHHGPQISVYDARIQNPIEVSDMMHADVAALRDWITTQPSIAKNPQQQEGLMRLLHKNVNDWNKETGADAIIMESTRKDMSPGALDFMFPGENADRIKLLGRLQPNFEAIRRAQQLSGKKLSNNALVDMADFIPLPNIDRTIPARLQGNPKKFIPIRVRKPGDPTGM